MKKKTNAKQRRETEASVRRSLWSLPEKTAGTLPAAALPPPQPVRKPEPASRQTPEEETRLFLEYISRDHRPVQKDDPPRQPAGKQKAAFPIHALNLEAGMPLVEEALDRMNMGLQEMRVSRVRAVKLIHGYGSTGRGGKICTAVRQELSDLKRKRLIRDWIPGEDFGPADAASRKLADQDRSITRDPDYGRMNHGITIAVL